jgi:putative ABC transport system permease protein
VSGAGGDLEGAAGAPGAAGDDRVAVLIGVARVTGTLLLTDAVGHSVRRLTAGSQSAWTGSSTTPTTPRPAAAGDPARPGRRHPSGAGVGVVTAASLATRQAGEVQGYLDGLRATLLAFAAVALLVGSFIIWNTFSVLVAGRTREVALLGATRRQVLGSVLAEATVVGLVTAAAGVAVGVGAAVGLAALLRGLGNTLPPAGLALAPPTVLAGLAVGTLVTVAAALARRASRVAPLEAIRQAAPATAPPAGRARTAVGLDRAVAGAAGLATPGIANTLALAVVERTREFRLLRAVGMTARQLAAMVRWESLITAASRALLGLGLGIAVGAALARAVTIQQAGVATIALPASRLLVDLALAGTAGLVAGAVPARRAARLDPLTAIGTE